MDQQKPKFRFVYRRSSLAVKIIVITAIVLCIGTLITLSVMTGRYRDKLRQIEAENVSQTRENNQVQEHIDQIGTPQSTERIAREELDLYPSDSVIFETTE